MDGWVLGIVEDTIDKVDRNDPSSSNALRTGKIIPNSIESMKRSDFPKKHSIGTFSLLTTIAPTASFRHNLPSNNNKNNKQQKQHSTPLKLAQSIDLKAIIIQNQSKVSKEKHPPSP